MTSQGAKNLTLSKSFTHHHVIIFFDGLNIAIQETIANSLYIPFLLKDVTYNLSL